MARQNLTAVPAYGADLAASAIGGLLGLNIDWGRALLVAGILVLGRRLVRPGALTPRVVGLVVAVGSFWLLVALGRAQMGAPASTRYVYTGAMLIVLLVVEVVRDTFLTPRVLGIAGAVALFALAGNIRLLTGGEDSLRYASSIVSAELGALQDARGVTPAGLVVDPAYAPQVFAGRYFAAIDAIRASPAESLSQVLHQSEPARTAADTLLARAGELQVTSVARDRAGAISGSPPTVEDVLAGSSTVRGSCVRFRPVSTGVPWTFSFRLAGSSSALAPACPSRCWHGALPPVTKEGRSLLRWQTRPQSCGLWPTARRCHGICTSRRADSSRLRHARWMTGSAGALWRPTYQ